MCDQPRGPGRAVEFRAAGQAGIDDDRDAVERERCLGDGSCQHDPPTPLGIAPDRGALARRIDLPVQREDERIRQAAFQPFARALDLAHAWQEGKDVARLFAPGRADRLGDRVFHRDLWHRAQPFDLQRVRAPRAFDHTRIVTEQRAEARAVDGRRHDQHAQILAQHRPAFERERKPQVAVEVPFVRFVEQYRRNACQLGIGKHGVDENRLGHDQHARSCGSLRVEPGQITDRFAGLFPQRLRHPLGRGPRCNASGRSEDHGAIAPRLVQQCGRHRGRLACARRRDQHGPALHAQRVKQIGQDRVDG